MKPDLTALLTGPRRKKIAGGNQLRLLSAFELLEARREASALAKATKEKALCANACLLAKALEKNKQPVFQDGQAVLHAMTASQIAALTQIWAEFDHDVNPSPEDNQTLVQQLKKAWSTRRMSAFNGTCSKPSALSPQNQEPET